ncbi:GspE/PulE family protein [Spirochaetota bacterium]
MKENLLLAYNFYILKEHDDSFDIIAKEELPIDVRDYIGNILGKKVYIKEINPKKVDAYFKKVIFSNKTKSSIITEGLSGAGRLGAHEKIEVNFNDATAVKLVNSILEEAVEKNASDIHIEPQEENMRTRYRIDGELKTTLTSPLEHFPAVSSRIKYLAKLDITQKLIPQDGKASVEIGGMFLDLRISTIPTKYGESVVVRILNREEEFIDLGKIGFNKETELKIRDLLKLKNGLVLLTGPTGSGKSTTLYSMLKILNKDTSNILTVEDPVEYEIPGINQVEINPLQGITFPSVLKHFLRHDPDIIMIGEIRDEETARIAIQSSLTGHLVLSTLHTNDTTSAITRLIDLGIEPFLISSSLRAVIAQRLVRKLCVKCRKKIKMKNTEKKLIKQFAPKLLQKKGASYYAGASCKECFGTGYRGRTAVFEYLHVNREVQDLIISENPEEHIRKHLVKSKFQSLAENVLEKLHDGITSFEEVEKILYTD